MSKVIVKDYSIETLADFLAEYSEAEHSESDPNRIRLKNHYEYFQDYFNYLNAKTIVVEPEYVDRAYIEDYAGYYARCFRPYRRFCTRLHFFSYPFSKKIFTAWLNGSKKGVISDDLMQLHYLGFIVVRPLPESPIGRTCLKVYPPDDGRRYFKAIRSYNACLVGKNLTVDSLAFQEQDRAASACATSALWSVFHGTSVLFQHEMPSPIEITRRATKAYPIASRSLPSQGLSIEQMAAAIRLEELEPWMVNPNNKLVFQAEVYGYLRFGIPGLLVFDLYDCSRKQALQVGKHAVAVTGYSLGKTAPEAVPETGLLLQATRIDKVYVHDDQVGPFARMKLDHEELLQKNELPQKWLEQDGIEINMPTQTLSTSWKSNITGKRGKVRAVPRFLLFPLYHKIRIPHERIFHIVRKIDFHLNQFRIHGYLNTRNRIVWDTFLCSSNYLKHLMHKERLLFDRKHRMDILEQSFPRFLWCAKAYDGVENKFTLIFDGTGVEKENPLFKTLEYDSNFVKKARELIEAVRNLLIRWRLPLVDIKI